MIGEAARSLPAEIRDQAPAIPWPEIIGMRHILVHHYFGVDAVMVSEVIDNHLPKLKRETELLLGRLERGG